VPFRVQHGLGDDAVGGQLDVRGKWSGQLVEHRGGGGQAGRELLHGSDEPDVVELRRAPAAQRSTLLLLRGDQRDARALQAVGEAFRGDRGGQRAGGGRERAPVPTGQPALTRTQHHLETAVLPSLLKLASIQDRPAPGALPR
jgi:hypothetical protein